MKERSIIFRGPMVRAILEGRKTQTRRIMKPQPHDVPNGAYCNPYNHDYNCFTFWTSEHRMLLNCGGDRDNMAHWRSPYGTVGDRLWVKWRPSIHMPRWASRIKLEITGVRVERLQNISEADAQSEGIFETPRDPGFECWSTHGMRDYYATPRRAFRALWDSINEKRGFGWSTNPWVWVIEFRMVES